MTRQAAGSALWLLARRKLVGRLRLQLRRLRTPAGALLALLGVSLFGLWVAAIQFRPEFLSGDRDPEQLAGLVRLGGLFLVLFTIGSSLTYRGLFLPAEEIERLFSAPLSRASIVRYRLVVNAARSLFAGVLFGLILMGRLPHRGYGFFGLLLAIQTLPVVGQATAVLAGGLERRSLRSLRGWPGGLARVVCLSLGMVVFLLIAFGGAEASGPRRIAELLTSDGVGSLLEHRFVVALTLPFEPSAYVSERIRRHRRAGGGASSSTVSRATAAWRIPWLLGRGPGGAIAWRKATAIVRKARGTVIVSVFVLSLVTLFVATVFAGDSRRDIVGGATVIAVLGTLYLGAGLRFDFREDLDRMEAIKAWPHSPARIFAATVIPQVALIASLEIAGIGLRVLATRQFDPWLIAVALVVPLFVFAWVALDNAVFLFAPVRFVPGQEGALQNAGRTVLLMLVRGLLLAAVAVLVGAAFGLAYGLVRHVLGITGEVPWIVGFTAAWAVLLGCDLALIAVGARVFRRFDVARDRG